MAEFAFIGGPLDGQRDMVPIVMDVIEYRVDALPRLLPRTTVPKRHEIAARHFYRRSLRGADIYVYQP